MSFDSMSVGFRSWARARRALMTAAVLALAASVEASDFTIDRTRIELSKDHASEVITILNRSTEPLRLQVTGFRWSQPAGEPMLLEPTDEIVYFPTVLQLEPGASRQVRIGYVGTPPPREQAYRIIFEELPPATAGADTVVRVLTRLNVPVFVHAPRQSPSPRLGAVAREGATVIVPVHNAGSSHVVIEAVTVSAVDGQGQRLFSEEVSGWYVLAGSANVFNVALPADCGRAAAFHVAVRSAAQTLTTILERGDRPCK
jgi:fimbrial chaperone protein